MRAWTCPDGHATQQVWTREMVLNEFSRPQFGFWCPFCASTYRASEDEIHELSDYLGISAGEAEAAKLASKRFLR